jgi:hypothetical protein
VFGSVLPSQDDIHPELPINAVIRFFMASIDCSSIIADDRNTTMLFYAHHIGATPGPGIAVNQPTLTSCISTD